MRQQDGNQNNEERLVQVFSLPEGVSLLVLGLERESGVTLTRKRMEELRAAIAEVRDTKPRGLIIAGSREDMFCVGADIGEIRDVVDPRIGTELARLGQVIFDEISSLPFPTVAAISGPCVGGAFELALACSYRIASTHPTTLVGLPEVNLGIIPGFGGTQRLPRLVGLPRALDIILGGKMVRAGEARSAGLVDAVVEVGSLIEKAVSLIGQSSTARPKLKFTDRVLTFSAPGRAVVKRRAKAQVLKKTKGRYPAPLAAIDVSVYGLEYGLPLGLEREAKELGRLVVTPESKALVHVFLATEVAKSLGKKCKAEFGNANALVVGAGVMGSGIGAVLARNGLGVYLKDALPGATDRAKERIKVGLEKSRSLKEHDKVAILDRVYVEPPSPDALSSSGIVVEAIVEDIEAKRNLFKELAGSIGEKTILASNTSSLSISALQNEVPHPERVVGLHFFNPVEKMPLIEIVRGKATDDNTVLWSAGLTVKLGKYPIVVNDVPGFLVNRILVPYFNSAAHLALSGYEVGDIDQTALAFGLPMGPFRLLDEVGLDVADHVSKIMHEGYGDRMAPFPLVSKLLALGRKGRKSGGGFYDYDSEGQAVPLKNLRETLGITVVQKPIQADRDRVTDALVLSLVGEAVTCLDEGVAGSPSRDSAMQIDLGSVMGFGFPPFRGGVLYYAEQLGAKDVLARFNRLHEAFGARFLPPSGIKSRGDANGSFFAATAP